MLILTEHVKDRMQERKINLTYIQNTIKKDIRKQLDLRKERASYKKLTVVFIEELGDITVLTCYKYSK